MANSIINNMVNAINNEIVMLKNEFETNGRSEWYKSRFNHICGMIDMLKLTTGGDYYIDERGLIDRKTNEPLTVSYESEKRVAAIEGYTISLPSKGNHNIMVLGSDNCVVEFEELNRAEYPILIHAFEHDPSIVKYVVADCNGVYEF